MHEQLLRDPKIGVCCAVYGTRITGPTFFDRSVNTEVYMNIFEEFCAQLTEEQIQIFLPPGRIDMPHFSDVPAASS